MTTSEHCEAKARLRRAATAARDAAFHAPDAPTKQERATSTLLRVVAKLGAGPIAGFLPIRTEIDPRPAMTALHNGGETVCVPVMCGPDQPLAFRHWTPQTSVAPGAFGVSEPVDGAWVVPRIVITPLLAFDDTGQRLGYGGGFYDRTFAQLPSSTRRIGFAFEAQRMPSLPAATHDVPLDGVVTEGGVFEPDGR